MTTADINLIARMEIVCDGQSSTAMADTVNQAIGRIQWQAAQIAQLQQERDEARAGERERCVNIMQSIVVGKPQIFSRAAIKQLDYITAAIRAGEEKP